jgi:hypothetical protein
MTRQNGNTSAAPAAAPQRVERSSRPERSERPSAAPTATTAAPGNNKGDGRSAAARAMDEFTTDPSTAAGK